jgi:SAM-dependent methyltransferase
VSFQDHFSNQANEYATFRPQYPRELFEFIASQSRSNEQALDCATGNGQAAIALAEFFQHVFAIDASAAQIENALRDDRVEYRVAEAEATGLEAHSVAAITVAQALHWLNLDRFYEEARRVLQSQGILAVWAYNYLRISPEIDPIIKNYHDEIVGPFWPPERRLVGVGYRELPFPFNEIATPTFEIAVQWSFPHLVGYLRTWSATQRFMRANEQDPVQLIEADLARAWRNPAEKRLATWPLTLRLGRA